MAITTAGLNQIAALLLGEAVTNFAEANAHIGVGDSSTAFSIAQTDLQAASNKFRQPVDAGFPTRSGAALTFEATYATTDANFAWNEWGIFNAASSGEMLLREVETLGTKTSAQQWVFTATVTLAEA